jgi:HSP20 family molecular chaperone IbpA
MQKTTHRRTKTSIYNPKTAEYNMPSAVSTHGFSRLFCAISFIGAPQIGFVSGVESMSAKWRRSRKNQKWLDFNDIKISPPKTIKLPRLENFKANSRFSTQKYRLPKKFGKGKYKEPKPLLDMFQDTTWVTVVAEIAGFTQENFKIAVKDQKLTLSAKAKDRRYYKSLNLPKVVIPTVAHTTFKNGVLEIKLKKALKEETIKQQAGINDAP